MSSAATAGPPPNYPHHNPNGGRPVGVTNGFKQNGDTAKKTPKVFKHIEDLLAARADININAPIRTILAEGEMHAKNADSYFDFRRPDLSLEEYIKASNIAVDLIPRHKDYPELQSERGDLHRLYFGLQKRLRSQQDRFDEVKSMIKENNAQNGIRSANYKDLTNPDSDNVEAVRALSHSFDKTRDKGRPSNLISLPDKENGLRSSIADTGVSLSTKQPESKVRASTDKRPVIHPKPEALQGRSIKPKSSPTKNSLSSGEDLSARFARLRGSENKLQVGTSPPKIAPVQDPRIKTRPIVVPPNFVPTYDSSSNSSPSHSRGGSLSSRSNRPLGPRDLPYAPSKPLKIALGVQIPEMPRPPEAVYSPARNLDGNSHGEILTQDSQSFIHSFSRTPSMDSTRDLGRGLMNMDDSNPYFYSSPVSNKASFNKPSFPDLSSLRNITAEQLQKFMQLGSQGLSILLVDIRNRDDFDNGHIMWQSIICIEPLTLRAGVSAEQIEQSLVISPDDEQRRYAQRNEFSVVVYYDQCSSSSSTSPIYGRETAVQDFHKAVYEFSYEKPLQNRPLLLEGGLDAWIDLVGEGALATSKSTLTVKAHAQDGTNSQLSRNEVVSIADAQQRSKQKSQDLGYFSNVSGIDRDEPAADELYFRTTDDFMRRFPAVSDIKESMVTPSKDRLVLASQVPTYPPQAMTPGGKQMFSRLNSSTATSTDFQHLWGSGRIGLHNRGNLCYMNSAVQALSSVHEIRDYLFRGAWLRNRPSTAVPVPFDDGQQATKTFSNLLMHLWTSDNGKPDYVNPRTFVATINRLHLQELDGRLTRDLYGGRNQLDSEEFLQFLLNKIVSETTTVNLVPVQRTDTWSHNLDEAPLLDARRITLESLNLDQHPPISKMLSYCTIAECHCTNDACDRNIRLPEAALTTTVIANFPAGQEDNERVRLEDLLQQGRQEALLNDYQCRYCSQTSITKLNTYYATFPSILHIQIARHRGFADRDPTKIKAEVQFPENGLNMTSFRVPGEGVGDIIYDCFAVICHLGDTLTGGHYITYRRDMAKVNQNWTYGGWWQYNDERVTQAYFNEISLKNAYILFYRKRGTY